MYLPATFRLESRLTFSTIRKHRPGQAGGDQPIEISCLKPRKTAANSALGVRLNILTLRPQGQANYPASRSHFYGSCSDCFSKAEVINRRLYDSIKL